MKIYFLVSTVFFFVYPLGIFAVEQDYLAADQLFDRWIQRHSEITSVSPITIRVERKGSSVYSGAESEIETEYYAPGYLSSFIERNFTESMGVPKFPVVAAGFVRADKSLHASFLRRNLTDSDFVISLHGEELNDSQLEKVNTFERASLYSTLRGIESADLSLGVVSTKEISNGNVVASMFFSNPIEVPGSIKLIEIEATFSQEQDWLPVQIIATYIFATGERASWISKYSDFRTWEGMEVPFQEQTFLFEANPSSPFLISETKIMKLERCSLKEVRNSCTFAYYGFPNLDKSEPLIPWLLTIVCTLILLLVAYFYVNRIRS